MSEKKVCLDLFAGLGGFSQAFSESPDWEVVTVDIEERFEPDIQADVMDLRPSDLPDADVVLASPPCTCFSTSGTHELWDFDRRQPIEEPAKTHVALAFHALGLIHGVAPDYWFLENPRRGRLRWYFGAPDEWVSYCQYGRDVQKDTGLWGEFPPMEFYKCQRKNASCHQKNVEYDGTSATRVLGEDPAKRAKVPYELSKAILDGVEGRAEQQTLKEVSSDV